jgi:hypothetical protein
MPNLPETNESAVTQVAAAPGPLTRAAVEATVVAVAPEATKANTTLGSSAGEKLKAKSEGNTAFGEHALQHATTGKLNSGFGYGALTELTTGTANTALGEAALIGTTTGSENVAVGGGAGASITTGEKNVFIGVEAGNEETAGNSNKLIIANNRTTPIISGVMSATAASQELGFFGHAPATKPEVTLLTVTAKELAEKLATLGLIKGN